MDFGLFTNVLNVLNFSCFSWEGSEINEVLLFMFLFYYLKIRNI